MIGMEARNFATLKAWHGMGPIPLSVTRSFTAIRP